MSQATATRTPNANSRRACRACGGPSRQGRTLCRRCRLDPVLRAKHARFHNRGHPDRTGRRPLDKNPTDFPPGSAGKVAVLEDRARRGVCLWHPLDAPPPDGRPPGPDTPLPGRGAAPPRPARVLRYFGPVVLAGSLWETGTTAGGE